MIVKREKIRKNIIATLHEFIKLVVIDFFKTW